jgi:hypothetical protein
MKKILAAVLFVPSLASAEFMTGNQLFSDMNGTTMEKMYSLGYVIGVMDTITNATVCPPANINAGQVMDVVKNYLEANPAIRHYTADSLIRSKLENTWPCQRGRGV